MDLKPLIVISLRVGILSKNNPVRTFRRVERGVDKIGYCRAAYKRNYPLALVNSQVLQEYIRTLDCFLFNEVWSLMDGEVVVAKLKPKADGP